MNGASDKGVGKRVTKDTVSALAAATVKAVKGDGRGGEEV